MVSTPGDREGAKALQNLSEARSALARAEAYLLTAQQLLEAVGGVRWGALDDLKQVERRILLFTAHRAWAVLDQGFKKVMKRQWGLAGVAAEHQGEHEGQGGAVGDDRGAHDSSKGCSEPELPATGHGHASNEATT